MFIPASFAIDDFDKVKEFINQIILANIIASQDNSIEICPLPLLWQDDGSDFGNLIGHIAKNNPIADYLSEKECHVVFTNNGHYISPNWYPSKAITHKEVPTWNYQSVQLTVKPNLYFEEAKIKQIIGNMTDSFEQQFCQPFFQPWSIDDAPQDFIDKMCKSLIGLKFEILGFDAKFKLSQNKSDNERRGVAQGLAQLNTPSAIAMANLV